MNRKDGKFEERKACRTWRNRLFSRSTTVNVVLADMTEQKVQHEETGLSVAN